MNERLISFRYHPDVLATGSAEVTDQPCDVCGDKTGYRYVGPVLGRQVANLCLNCIKSGRAAAELARPDGPAEFTDVGTGVVGNVSSAVLAEVSQRTPGFIGWQQEHWMFHCDDAAAYLGRAGYQQLAKHDDALDSLMEECRALGMDAARSEDCVRELADDRACVAYLFKCLHCGTHLAYADGA